MRWISTMFLIVSFISLACILGVESSDSENAVAVEILLSVPSRIDREDGLAGTIHLLKLLDCYEVKDFSTIPVRSGPLDFVNIFSLSGKTFISFQTIIPTNPVITVSSRKIKVIFKKSDKRYDYSFSDSMELGDAMKYFSEVLGINISVSSKILHTKLPSLRLENMTPEDAFRTILVSLGLVYSYFPNGVMYIGDSVEDLRKKLFEIWGVSSEESLLDAVRAGVLKTLSNESMIFTMGPNESLRRIVGEAEKEYYDVITVGDKDVAKSILKELIGDNLKVITTLPGSALMVYGKARYVREALDILKKTGLLIEKNLAEKDGEKYYRIMRVMDTKSVEKIVEQLYPAVKVVPIDENVVIYGGKGDIAKIEDLLENLGLIGTEIRGSSETVSKPQIEYEILKVDNPQEIASYIKGILDVKVITGSERIMIVGKKEEIEEAKKLVEKLINGEEEKIEVWETSDPDEISKILESVFEGLKVVPGKKEIIVKGYKHLVERAKDLLKRIGAFEKDRKIEIIDFKNPERISKILTDIFPDLKIVFMDDHLLLSGSPDSIATAREIISKMSKPKVVFEVVDSKGISEDQLKALRNLGNLFGVEIIGIPSSGKFVLVGGNEEDLSEIRSMMEKVSSGESDLPVVVEDGRVTVDVDSMPLSDLIKTVLGGFGKGVVILEDISTPVKMKVSKITLEEFLTIIRNYGVELENKEDIFFVREKREIQESRTLESTGVELSPSTTVQTLPPSTPSSDLRSSTVEASGDLLNIVCENCRLSKVMEDLARERDMNVVFVDKPDFPVTMKIKNVSLDEFFDVVRSFGYVVSKKDDVYYVQKMEEERIAVATSTVNLEVKERDGKVFILAENVPLATVIRELSKAFRISVVMIDAPSENVSIRVENMTFEDLKDLLDKFGYTFEEIDGINYLIKKGRTIIGKVVYGFDKLQDLVNNLGGQMFYDSTTGMIIARNLSSGAYTLVRKYMETLKKSPPQVSIQVKLIEKFGNEGLNFGSATELDGKEILLGSNFPSSGGGMGELRINTSVISSASYEKLLRGLLGGELNLTLNGVKNIGNFRLIASPSVTVMSGEEAKIVIGGEDFVTLDGTVVKYTSGVDLRITPYVRPDGKIDLKVRIELSDITSLSTSGVSRKTRSAQTRVVLRNGQTLVIGGLMREVLEESISKLPILGDLPVVGWLFRSKSERKEISNLTIFITAKVVRE